MRLLDYAFIVAQDRLGTIGKNNNLPWKLSSDMQFFKQHTLGKAVIMGRKTWESLPKKPLPERLNIVVSTQLKPPADNSFRVARSTDEALSIAQDAGMKPIVIGGEQIFNEMLQRASEVFLTQVNTEIEDGDTFFQKLDSQEWEHEHLGDFDADQRNQFSGTFYRYFRALR